MNDFNIFCLQSFISQIVLPVIVSDESEDSSVFATAVPTMSCTYPECFTPTREESSIHQLCV